MRSINELPFYNVLQNIRNKPITKFNDIKWKQVIDNQEFDLFIFEIREEILSKVFETCQQNYIREKCVNYVVECAFESWKKLIELNFFYHESTDEFYNKNNSWLPDAEPAICESDSWAKGNIVLRPKTVEKRVKDENETVLSDYQLIKCEEYPTDNIFDTTDIVSVTKDSSVDGSLAVLYETKNKTISALNFNFTTPHTSEICFSNERLSSTSDVKRNVSSELFCKKKNSKKLSVHSFEKLPKLKITPSIVLPRCTYLEDMADRPMKIQHLPPLRYNVISLVKPGSQEDRRESRAAGRSVNFQNKFPMVSHDEPSVTNSFENK